MPIEIFKVFRKEKAKYAVSRDDVRGVIQKITDRINNIDPNLAKTDTGRSLRERFFYWANLPEDPQVNFHLVDTDSGVDVALENGKVAFSLGVGEKSLFFENRSFKKDSLIFKTESLDRISDRLDVFAIIEGFIRFDAHGDEIYDISRDTLKQKMFERTQRAETKSPLNIGTLRRNPKKQK